MNLLKEVYKQGKPVSCKVLNKVIFSCAASLLLITSPLGFAEDIELYLSENLNSVEVRPQVLIIFDDSGSMSTKDDSFTAEYDPAITYGTKGAVEYIYYTDNDSDISDLSVDDDRKFPASINGCETSHDILDSTGYYSDKINKYRYKNNGDGEWDKLSSNSGSDISVLDCKNDVSFEKTGNAEDINGTVLPSGYPIDGKGSESSPTYYTTKKNKSNSDWDKTFTLYTSNYLRWSLENPPGDLDRLEVAQISVKNLIEASPGVDFGLEVFNRNQSSSNSGGRIIHGIKETTGDNKTNLLALIDDLTHNGWTPLCESLYESYRYLGSKSVYYGDDRDSSYDTPERDKTIETESKYYETPYSNCDETVYIVLISDGEPTRDTDADGLVKALDGLSSIDQYEGSYLPALAGWMNDNDVNTTIAGKQNAEIYTIGFGSDVATDSGDSAAAKVLTEAALRGGGEYYPATDSASLTAALTSVLANINPSNNTLTSASVASNNFDRTETLDSVYYSMFQPDRGTRWQGNLKKYKVTDGAQKGVNGVDAIDESTGHFSEDVQSYWSSSKDGDSVEDGGVAEMLRSKTNRVTVSDLGLNNGLVKLTYDDASGSNAFSTQTELAAALDVADDKTAIEEALDWINGRDVDDEDEDNDTSENRKDVFGDPLHSKPVVINYGSDNIYIVVGTNHGVVHMFKDTGSDASSSVDETWAFMPKEFLSNTSTLRENATGLDKVYGVDGLMTSHITDINGNGVVDGSDKVWLFFGFRRGGNSYYAMDITTPTDPSIMWTISGGSGDFKELGQSWSQPKVIYSKLNISGDAAKPALVFGGGYDTNKDSSGVGTEDSSGRAIYIVDAETGSKLWDLTPANGGGDTTYVGTDSIPASIGTLDSDGDGLTDRLYAGDTGGNIWRIDMPDSDTSKFSVFRLASFGSETLEAYDRRFYTEPAIVRASITETIDTGEKDTYGDAILVQQDIPYDAVLIGSGDRTNPLETTTNDAFFMVKDANIATLQFTDTSVPAIPTSPIIITDLANYTSNPFDEDLAEAEREALAKDVSEMSGWFIDLILDGEKSSASPLVINNIVYYTTYTPPESDPDSCELANGSGWLYAVDLALGTNKYNWESPKDRTDERITYISEQFLGAPTLIVTKDSSDSSDSSDDSDDSSYGTGSEGNIIVGRTIMPVGFHLQTLRTYLYINED